MGQTMALYLVGKGLDWEQALHAFKNYQVSGNLSAKTILNREECLLLLARSSGKQPLDITLEDLQAQLSRPHPRTGKHLAQGTMQSERSYFQTFYGWLKDEGYMRGMKNPSKRLRKIKMTRRLPRPLRAEQIDAMLDTGAYSRTRDIITIAALTGLRIGEVVRIRGEDIDREGMMISAVRKGNLLWRGAIPEGLLPILDKYPTRGWWFPSPYISKLFPNGGGHILMTSASDAVSKAMRRAGITDRNLTAHSLRHYLATTMLRNGASLRVVQETLGHASLATTQLYTGVTEEEMSEGINVVPPIALRKHSGRRGKIAA
ncbi:MAG: hypothetical protein JWP85_2149 [Rhodoglobus sp.]|nr:hypothetical protein [Rhodoglobus sp.]